MSDESPYPILSTNGFSDRAAELRRLVTVLGISSRWIADEITGLDDRLVRRWMSGRFPPPPEVIAWLQGMEKARDARPTLQAAWFIRPATAEAS